MKNIESLITKVRRRGDLKKVKVPCLLGISFWDYKGPAIFTGEQKIGSPVLQGGDFALKRADGYFIFLRYQPSEVKIPQGILKFSQEVVRYVGHPTSLSVRDGWIIQKHNFSRDIFFSLNDAYYDYRNKEEYEKLFRQLSDLNKL